MLKKSQHMTKNQKLDALRVDIAKILEAVETLTHRLDAVIPSARKTRKRVRKNAKRQASAAPMQDKRANEVDEDDKAVSLEDEDDKAVSIAD